jgi:hypothetical protein
MRENGETAKHRQCTESNRVTKEAPVEIPRLFIFLSHVGMRGQCRRSTHGVPLFLPPRSTQ